MMGRVELQNVGKAIGEEHNGCKTNFYKKGALACTINTEIGTVLAVMRRNVRWGGHFISGDDRLEHSLIQSLKSLRKQIFTWQNQWHNINPVLYLQPFLDVIRSEETGAPITGVALSSVYKILALDVFDQNTVHVEDTMHLVIDAVTSCRFEVTDPASEEVVLMKVLQVLLACMKSRAAAVLNNQHVCTIADTCFRVVHQAGTKGELLQRIARHTMHEVVRCIFSRLPEVNITEHATTKGSNVIKQETQKLDDDHNFTARELDNGNGNTRSDDGLASANCTSSTPVNLVADAVNEKVNRVMKEEELVLAETDIDHMKQPYGVPCMVEVFQFLCSLLNLTEHVGMGARSNTLAFDEDVPLFALSLINSAIELGGSSFCQHPRLLNLIQDDLFCNLLQFGSSMSPLILSMVCSIVLNLYHHLRTELKLQLEAFFSSVILRLAQSRHGASYQQQEVAMEALVDFCRQKTFMVEMFANFDCDITCNNVFEDLVNLLSKSAFPVNSPLSAMHVLALDGLVAVVQGMAERVENGPLGLGNSSFNLEAYTPFWTAKCDNYREPSHWVPFVCERKFIKRRLMAGADHFNRGTKKGLEFLQGTHLLPEKPDAQSVACFFRYTGGLDKNQIGDFLGNHDEFSVQVLHEFARTFDFKDLSLDDALRIFLETFRLPGESQKIQRVLEAFSERYYEQSPDILANKDAALLLSYSIIMLNTDQHNVQVKKKMTEEDFIRNNRRINGGNDLPREYLSQLYHSICKNEIRTIPEQGAGFFDMTSSSWLGLMHKSKKTAPYIMVDNRPYLDREMFAIISGPAIAAISVVFDNVEDNDVYQTCIDGFLAVAKIAAGYHLVDVLDDLVISLCKFTTLLEPAYREEFMLAFREDAKARMSTVAVFTIVNKYGDFIRTGWRNILDCILRLYEFRLLSSHVARDAADEAPQSAESGQVKPLSSPQMPTSVTRRPSGLMSRFSLLLSFETEEPRSEPTEDELAAQQSTLETIQKCSINNIFMESKFLQADSLLQLARAVMAAGLALKETGASEDEACAVFCLDLLVAITLNNRDRISLLWQDVYDHICNIVQSTAMPCSLVEKAVFGLLRICQRLLPYKENLVDELLKSLQLVLKLDARVADAYCEQITQEVGRLVKANATHIRSQIGWRVVLSLLAITARHPDASEAGFDALSFIMSDRVHLLPSNFVLCVDAARQFAESRVGQVDRSVHALNLMAGSVDCLVHWARETKDAMKEEEAAKMCQDIGEMWLRLVQGFKKCCVDNREEVRNHALLSLQKCLMGAHEIHLPGNLWLQCFDLVIFPVLDDLLEIAQGHSHKNYRNMEASLTHALKLLSKVFLLSLNGLMLLTTFSKLWVDVLSHMEKYMKVKIRGRKSETLHELVPELLKNTLLVMKTGEVFTQLSNQGGDSFWELTWSHVNNIAPSLQSEVFPDKGEDQPEINQGEEGTTSAAIAAPALAPAPPAETVASEG